MALENDPRRRAKDERLASALGWLSLGLAAGSLGNPRGVARMTGVPDNEALLRAIGARELATGVGILSRKNPAAWLWARVAGDIMDLSLLTATLTTKPDRRERVAATTAVLAGVTALDVYCSERMTADQTAEQNADPSADQGAQPRAAAQAGA